MSESALPDKISTLKVPPHSIEAEQAVLGALMLDDSRWDSVAELLLPSDFYRKEHQLLFDAMQRQAAATRPIDVLTLSELLRSSNQLEEAGDVEYLGELVNGAHSGANIVAYAQIIKERAILRKLISTAHRIADSGYNPDGRSSAELLDEAEQQVYRIADERPSDGGPQAVTPILKTAVERIEQLFHAKGSITGLATGFKDLDEMTSGLQPSDLVIVAGRPSMGKCIVSGSRLVDPDSGARVTIDELVRKGQGKLHTLGADFKLRTAEPSAFVDDGLKPVFKVTTALGREIETTQTHPFLTEQGWQPLANMQPGMRIGIPRTLPVFGTQTLPAHEITLLADQLADGALTHWQQTQGLRGKPATEKRVPDCVFRLPREQLALFLNRLFACDGSVGVQNEAQVVLTYASSSRELARDVQHLLLRFGVLAQLKARQVEYGDERREAWELVITHRASIERFNGEIGISGKEQRLADACRLLTRQRARLFADQQDEAQLADSDIYWDTVVSIEATGLKQVYDLTVPETHNFVAEDILVHNTTFAMNMVEHAVLHGEKPVLVFSLEMPADSLIIRMLSSIGKIDQTRMRNGKLEHEDWDKLTVAVSKLRNRPLFIDDSSGLSPGEMRARARRLVREHGPLGMIMVDYLQLMQIKGSSENRTGEISEISRSLKLMAREFSCPVVALSQLNRSLEQRPNKRPVMSDLRESGAIEQDADVIMFVYRHEVYEPEKVETKGVAEIIIGKQRNGPIGTVNLSFIGKHTRFADYAPMQGGGPPPWSNGE